MKKYFEVVAKCGHVGRGHYYKGAFYEVAESGKAAAAAVRLRPRVKHDHPDAILCVTEITYEDYKAGLEQKKSEPYFFCTCVQEQRAVWEQIAPNVYREPRAELVVDECKAERREHRRSRVRFVQAKQKCDLRFSLQGLAEAFAY